MRVPLSWLKDYVEIDIDAESLAEKLTAFGVPVEGVSCLSPQVSGVVSGKILSVRKHPNADRLRICEVDVENKSPIQIVTGAKNVKEGDIVPVALHGARLFDGTKIKKSKLRGEVSEGMMCSAKELGLDLKDLPPEEREGVMILPPDTPIGSDLASLYCLSDPVLEIETFANRPDQLSILGIAYEVAAVLGKDVKEPPIFFKEDEKKAEDILSVKVEDFELCPRYTGRVILDVPIKKSPLWMQGRLIAAGIRPINNVVDITNYVMLETGQPLHAFDFDKISGGKIIVRRAYEGEKIVTIDGKERVLDSSILVIADEKGAVAIAGVMGGLDTEVSNSTKRILLESANFNGASVRRTSIKLALRSESSKRFEKGIDFYRVDLASKRACYLMAMMGGVVLRGCVEDSVPPPKPVSIKVRHSRVNKILGTSIPKEDLSYMLKRLRFKVTEDGDEFVVTPPLHRKDLNYEIDVIEDVARLFGYDNIPTTTPEGVSIGGYDEEYAFENEIRDILTKCGLLETITLSLYSEEFPSKYRLDEEHLKVKNPITSEQALLRRSLIPHLMEVVKRNISVKNFECPLFEISKMYSLGKDGVKEERKLCILLSSKDKKNFDFFHLKGILDVLFDKMKVKAIYLRGDMPYLHPNKTAIIKIEDVTVGFIGNIHPEILMDEEIEQDVVVSQIDIEKLMKCRHPLKYVPISRFPEVERDIAILVDEDVPAGDVEKVIMESGGSLLKRVRCFDVYKGEQIPKGKKSLAFSLHFSEIHRTLKDEEVQESIDNILKKLKDVMGATLRG